MRSILVLITIVFVAALLCGAILLLATGKSFVYVPGMASARSMGRVVQWGAAAAGAGLVVAAAIQVAGRAYPKLYYALQLWRDLALGLALTGCLAVVGAYLARALVYGAF
jgi:hypothetical protein